MREALAEAMTGLGLQVNVARNGEHALRSLMEHTVPERKEPFVVVLDMTMPVMDGVGFLERLEALSAKSSVRVVILSAAPVPDSAARHSTVSEVLQKPIDMERLLRAVTRAAEPA